MKNNLTPISLRLHTLRQRLVETELHIVAAFERLQRVECRCVARFSLRKPALQWFAVTLNQLGNGWLYIPLALFILLTGGTRRYSILIAAALSAGCAHLLYAIIKRVARRRRPFSADPSLMCLSQPLDLYSFPSGHCMTLTTVSVPLAVALPRTAAFVIAAWLLIAWARLASAHHYPSDVLAGTLLGLLIAWPFTALVQN